MVVFVVEERTLRTDTQRHELTDYKVFSTREKAGEYILSLCRVNTPITTLTYYAEERIQVSGGHNLSRLWQVTEKEVDS